MARWIALSLYAKEIEQPRFEDLSMTDATPELRAHGRRSRTVPRAAASAATARRSTRRAYRGAAVGGPARGPRGEYGSRAGFTWNRRCQPVSEFMQPLLLCYRSLHETGNGVIADGRLTDVLRRMAGFGLTLARLDIRQEAGRHAEAVDAIARTPDRRIHGLAGGGARRVSRRRPDARPQADPGRMPTTRAPPKCCRRSDARGGPSRIRSAPM